MQPVLVLKAPSGGKTLKDNMAWVECGGSLRKEARHEQRQAWGGGGLAPAGPSQTQILLTPLQASQ